MALIQNQCCGPMGKITGRWSQLANNVQAVGLKSRWLLTDVSESRRRKQSGGRRGCGVSWGRQAQWLLPGWWKDGMMSVWLRVHDHTYLGLKWDWCNASFKMLGRFIHCLEGWWDHKKQRQHQPTLNTTHVILWSHLNPLWWFVNLHFFCLHYFLKINAIKHSNYWDDPFFSSIKFLSHLTIYVND